MRLYYYLVCLALLASHVSTHAIRPDKRDYAKLPVSSVSGIASLSDPTKILDHRDPTSLLSRILIPRPPDTENSKLVRDHILDVFRSRLATTDAGWKGKAKLGWHIETPTFTAQTPEGPKRMTNIILTKNPAAPRKLVVSAHYDSKYFTKASGMSGFIGATDSAAPCAIMVDLAVALDDALDARERKLHAQQNDSPSRSQETTLQLIFFDGEEAYRTWTHTDSIYGSRQLAQEWTSTFWNASYYEEEESFSTTHKLAARRYRSSYSPVRHMDTIEHLILLDLLGTANPTVPSYFQSTEWMHQAMSDAEKRLGDAKVLYPDRSHGAHRSFFSTRHPFGGIEDDHLPFLHAGVHVLHVIPSPFPMQWHKLSDDATALHYPTVYAWAMILRLFVAEYLELDIPPPLNGRDTGESWTHKSIEL